MNFFAHAIAFLDNPYFVAGTSAPDWLSVADRPVRIRARLIDKFLGENDQDDVDENCTDLRFAFAAGARQHLTDDDWFHRQRVFTEVNADLAGRFRRDLGPDDNFRAGFLGHIVTEMLLDRVLIERCPELLDRYYEAVAFVDAEEIQATVGQIATRPTDRLSSLLPRFVDERFLQDYVDEKKLLFRLNQVMRRVKLPVLADEIEETLAESLEVVEARHRDLLPAHVLDSLDAHTTQVDSGRPQSR